MKKITTLFLFVFLLITYQSYSQARVGIGIKGGVNFNWFKADIQNTTTIVKQDHHVGLFTLVKFNKIGIQNDIIYSRQGTYIRPDASLNPDIDKYIYDFTYINVPIVVKYYLFKSFNVFSGPQIGILLNAEGVEFDQGYYNEGVDVSDQYKKTDFTWCAGLGWDWRFGLSIDARYNLGLSDIQNDSNIASTKNRGIQFSIGYRFIKFGKKSD